MTQTLLYEAIRVLFILGIPVVLVAAVSGLIVGALQAATTIRDPASAYAVRLISVAALLYAFLPLISETLVRFTQRAFGVGI